MDIRKAAAYETDVILEICRRTVKECYGKCYPVGAVDYFLNHHKREKVGQSVNDGQCYLCLEGGVPVATVSVADNYIHRFFVLPEYQGKGYGSGMLDFCEKLIFESFDEIALDASLPAFNMYRKRGYVIEDMVMYPLSGGEELCYFPMTKKRV